MDEESPFASLYPEFVEHGGVGMPLQLALNDLGSELLVAYGPALCVHPVWGFARVERGRRYCQVLLSCRTRDLSVSFWDRYVDYASGRAGSLTEAAAAIQAFVGEHVSTVQLDGAFAWVHVREHARFHEQGPESFVDFVWTSLLGGGASEGLASTFAGLGPVIGACALQPGLRRLMPYMSRAEFCLSQTTSGVSDPLCSVRVAGAAYEAEVGSERVRGNATEVAAMLARSLASCPPAAHG